MQEPSLLEITLNAAVRDKQTVTAAGEHVRRLTHGVRIRSLPTHADDRGSVIELFDPRWESYPDPVAYAYTFTIRPGYAKGWNLHRENEDRYAILGGKWNWCSSILAVNPPRAERFAGSFCPSIIDAWSTFQKTSGTRTAISARRTWSWLISRRRRTTMPTLTSTACLSIRS